MITEKRQPVYDFYNEHYDDPRFCITLPVTVPDFRGFCRSKKISSFQFLLHTIAKTSLAIPHFALRADDKHQIYTVQELTVSYTVLDANENVNFVTVPFQSDLDAFAEASLSRKHEVEKSSTLNVEDRTHSNYLFVSSLPWFEFTGIQNAYSRLSSAQIPIVVFGRFSETEYGLKIPMSIQGHHGLFDGFHVSQFVEQLPKTIGEIVT